MWGKVAYISVLRDVSLVIRNPLICEGFRRILIDNDFQIVSSSDVIESTLTDEGLIIVDRDLLPSEIFGDLKNLVSSHPRSRVVVLSSTFNREDAAEALAAGCYAFLISDTTLSACVDSMKLVSMGHKLAPSGLIDPICDRHPNASASAPQVDMAKLKFTEREQEILRHLVKGAPNKVISRDLGISESAVKASVKCVLRKLSVHNRTQAAIIARDIEFPSVSADLDRYLGQHRPGAGRRRVPDPEDDSPELPGLY